MIVNGRNNPVVSVRMDETGVLRIRVDFELYPAGWAEVALLNEDLAALSRGERLTANTEVTDVV